MAIAKTLRIAEEVADVAGDLVLSKKQARALSRFAKQTGSTRNKIKNWSEGRGWVEKATPSNQLATYVSGRVGSMQHLPGAPTSIGTRVRSFTPKFRSVGNKITVTNREIVGYVDQTSLGVRPFGNLNPTSPYVFPWLSTLANSYDRFKFSRLSFSYVPTCATTATGQITLAWDPSASDYVPDVTNLPLMHSVQVAPWMPADLDIPVGSMPMKHMGEQASTASGVAADFYSVGTLYVGTNGTGAAGILYANYTITLSDPQPSTGLSTVLDLFPGSSASGAYVDSFSTLDGFSTLSTNGYLLVPQGTWKLEILYTGTGLTGNTVEYGSGCSYGNNSTAANSGSTTIIQYAMIRSLGSLLSTIRFKVSYTTLNKYLVRITRIDPASFASAAIQI